MGGGLVSTAIIDAIAETADQPLAPGEPSRYAMPIANLPLIGHVLDEVAGIGFRTARIVSRRKVLDELEPIVGTGEPWGMSVSYVESPESQAEHAVLAEVARALADGPVLLHPAHCLLRAQMQEMSKRFAFDGVDSVISDEVQSMAPSVPSSPGGRGIGSTVALLGASTRDIVRGLLAGSLPQTGLVSALLESTCRIELCGPPSRWLSADSVESLLALNRTLLDELPVPAANGSFGESIKVHGRVAVSPGARIVNSVLHGPVAIDDGSVIQDSFIGPYTAIGPGTTITGAEIDNSMVLAGAEISYPGFRIEGSIIHERCQITRGFDLPRGAHLRLPPGSRITFT
jgi:glucose-1-phosphate thymidylyltransferase